MGMVYPHAPVLGRWPGEGGGRARVWVKPVGFHCGAPYGMGIWGFDASISDGPWDVGPWVRMTGQWGIGATVGCGLPVVGNGKFRPRRRGPKETPPGPEAPILRACRACWQRSPRVGPSAGLAPKDLDIATPGRGDDGRGLLHVGKQECGDDGAAEISQDIDDVCAEIHGRVPGQAQRGGFLLAPVHGFQVLLALLR